ncbi:MAG: hypothetical protein D6753_11395 [Planctomycetota bacterium]|nr:MAG: hypothetical protein D6753_11395 [Planctomycetota bacterium]
MCMLGITTIGCTGSPTAEPSGDARRQEDVSRSDPAPQVAAADPAEAIAALEASGARLKRSDDGLVTDCDLRGVDLEDALAESLVQLRGLRRLYADRGGFSREGWEQIGGISTLELLDLRGVSLDNAALAALVRDLPRLRALRLSGQNGATTVDEEGMAPLANCPQLRALALDHLWIGQPGLQKLVDLPHLAELYLAGTLVDDPALETLSKINTLRKLRLAQTAITADGLQHLTALPLEDLDISECSQVFDPAMKPVGKMVTLQRLNLWRDAITDAGVAHLANLVNLQWLNLDNTQLSDDGLEHLSNMSRLEFLHLGSTLVSDAGMPRLYGLKSLKDLKVTRTAVTEEGVKGLIEAIPGLKVQLKYVAGQ